MVRPALLNSFLVFFSIGVARVWCFKCGFWHRGFVGRVRLDGFWFFSVFPCCNGVLRCFVLFCGDCQDFHLVRLRHPKESATPDAVLLNCPCSPNYVYC